MLPRPSHAALSTLVVSASALCALVVSCLRALWRGRLHTVPTLRNAIPRAWHAKTSTSTRTVIG
jgi:hypothetical protein